jgi:hypothetical protein
MLKVDAAIMASIGGGPQAGQMGEIRFTPSQSVMRTVGTVLQFASELQRACCLTH